MEAMNKGLCACELICRLREVIEAGRNCKYTECNPLLITAEQTVLCAERELANAKSRFECTQSESHLAVVYRDVVADFRGSLKVLKKTFVHSILNRMEINLDLLLFISLKLKPG